MQLHQIQDVFIVEHEDCGAYQTFVNGINWEDSEAEWKCHHDTAEHLSQKIIGKKYFFVQHSDMRKKPTRIAHKKDQKTGAYISTCSQNNGSPRHGSHQSTAYCGEPDGAFTEQGRRP